MAGMKFSAVVDDETIVAATTETIIQLVAAANHGIELLAWGISFAGVGVTDTPIRVEIVRQSTAGTSSSLTLSKWDDGKADTLDTSALQGFSSTEPTTGDILTSTRIHPQAGYEIWYPEGKEIPCGAGDRIAVRVITPSGVNPNLSCFMVGEE